VKFPCTACGACCRRLNLVPAPMLRAAGLNHVAGRCEHLTADNLCGIYETRPDLCRVDTMIERLGMPHSEAQRLTAAVCNAWMAEDGITGKRVLL
jgi:Fe-S-cluster containining protein